MQNFFNTIDCTQKGCVNHKAKGCTLDKLPIVRFAEHLQYFQDSNTCRARKQVNIFRTETLIENK